MEHTTVEIILFGNGNLDLCDEKNPEMFWVKVEALNEKINVRLKKVKKNCDTSRI